MTTLGGVSSPLVGSISSYLFLVAVLRKNSILAPQTTDKSGVDVQSVVARFRAFPPDIIPP